MEPPVMAVESERGAAIGWGNRRPGPAHDTMAAAFAAEVTSA
jgi:hypothetical protein